MLLASNAHGTPPVTQPPADTVESVVVSAPEPRYVAPTLRDRIGRIWAPVLIEGRGPFRLVLDTGASHSAVVQTVVDRLGDAAEPGGFARLHGATGTAMVPMIAVDSMEVGDLILGETRLPIVANVFGGAEGVLGTDGLMDKRIFIDFRNDHISILRSKNQAPGPGFKRVPVKLRDNRLLMFDMHLGGVKVKAMLDTGAQATVGNNSLKTALEKRKREGVDTEILGVTMDVAMGKVLQAPTVNIGGILIRNMSITFGDIHIFDAWKLNKEPAILIGMDVIGVLDTLVIDYRRKELHLRARS